MDLSKETLENRKRQHKCLLCGHDLDTDGNCVENSYHTNDPS